MEVVGTVYGESIQTQWVPIDATSKVQIGGLVRSTGDGVAAMGAAVGNSDTTGKLVPYGVVIGTSNAKPIFDLTSNSDSITGVLTQAAQTARDNVLVEGQDPKGDKQAFAKIARIFPGTKIKARLYNGAFGVLPTLQTVTIGSVNGLTYTANAADAVGKVDLSTAHCRTGANGNVRRITNDTSATAIAMDRAFPKTISVGDTFVRVNIRPIGASHVQIDALGLFVNVGITVATNYYVAHIEDLNLKTAGAEYVIFTFDGDHFSTLRG